ncbi:MAG: nuclear transport factor 2 family protein [Rhodospirillales bacterium]|nr:MAG: nuclear transport factor 2 family protein [Rhodospirillales bacterium]
MARANRALYRAFVDRDIEAMDALWARAAPVACLHPGQPPLYDRATILASWRAILRNPAQPTTVRIVEDVVVARGDMGMVICREILPGAHLLATNVFTREDGAWRMIHHQSAQAPGPAGAAPAPPAPKRDRRKMH